MKNLVGRIDVLWGISDSVVLNKKTARNVLLFSFRNNIPFIGLSSAWVKAGALYALDRDYHDIGVQCAGIAHRIIEGEKADSIPLAAPRLVTFAINRRTAQKMAVSIDKKLINKANKLY